MFIDRRPSWTHQILVGTFQTLIVEKWQILFKK